MKTFTMTAIAATMVAGSAFAHPVNEPHVCGIDPDMVMDYLGFAQEDGTIYDKGDYFFVATNDNDLSGEYTTTHTRIWKDTCAVTAVEIEHKDSGSCRDTLDEEGNSGSNGICDLQDAENAGQPASEVYRLWDIQDNGR